jgi:hypothetical protein
MWTPGHQEAVRRKGLHSPNTPWAKAGRIVRTLALCGTAILLAGCASTGCGSMCAQASKSNIDELSGLRALASTGPAATGVQGNNKKRTPKLENHDVAPITMTHVPMLDVAPSCRGAAASAGSEHGKTMKRCLDDEQEARDQLVNRWSKFAMADRDRCVRSVSAFSSSYVELLTCVEMTQHAERNGSSGNDSPQRSTPTFTRHDVLLEN